jgi:tRNA threonylcarbamoyl adenosine modification protein YeaZ
MTNKITLAVETAVGGGSLSLFENDKLLDEFSGEGKISRSDRFLPVLDDFLNRNKINKRDLDLIAVSRGPGSFTGARIGLATAVALKNGLSVKCVGISILRAIAFSSMQAIQNDVVTAILNDKTQIIQEKFVSNSKNFYEPLNHLNAAGKFLSDGAKLQIIDDFVNEISSVAENTLVLLEVSLFDLIDEKYGIEKMKNFSEKLDIKSIGGNLSLFIGRAAIKKYASDNLNVIYLNSDKNYSI